MNIINKKSIVVSLLAVFLSGFVFVSATMADTAYEQANKGLNNTASQGFLGKAGDSDITDASMITNIPSAIGKVIGAGLAFIGAIFFILMIYGGFIWMFARGNEAETAKAKDLIVSAIIGMVIVLSAYAITTYVGNLLTSSS